MLQLIYSPDGGFTLLFALAVIVLVQTFRCLDLAWETPLMPIRHLYYSARIEQVLLFGMSCYVLWLPKLQVLGAILVVFAYYIAHNLKKIELERRQPKKRSRF